MERGSIAKGPQASVWGDGNVLYLDGVVVVLVCQNHQLQTLKGNILLHGNDTVINLLKITLANKNAS